MSSGGQERSTSGDGPTFVLGTVLRLLEALRSFSRTPMGRLFGLYAATIGWVVLWAAYDYVVVGIAFLAGRPVARMDAYWFATWNVLYPITTLLIFRRHAWLPILAVWIGGWEDILFYWIQGKAVPQDIGWFLTPTDEALYLRGFLFLVASLLVGILLQRRSLSRVRAPSVP